MSLSDFTEEPCECCDLSFKTRIYGGVICTVISFFFCWLAFLARSAASFAIIYSIGTFAGLASSFFIAGPKKHWSKLHEPIHGVSALVLGIAFLLVIISGLSLDNKLLVILCIIIQWGATSIFYLTMLPFGDSLVKGLFKCLF